MMTEIYKSKSNRQFLKTYSLLAGLLSVAVLFTVAIVMTRHPPLFGVQALAQERGIDTTAFFYTDIEECSLAEYRIASQMSSTQIKSNNHESNYK